MQGIDRYTVATILCKVCAGGDIATTTGPVNVYGGKVHMTKSGR